jgi:hypothetical protein
VAVPLAVASCRRYGRHARAAALLRAVARWQSWCRHALLADQSMRRCVAHAGRRLSDQMYRRLQRAMGAWREHLVVACACSIVAFDSAAALGMVMP